MLQKESSGHRAVGEQQTVMTFCSWFFAGPVFFLAK